METLLAQWSASKSDIGWALLLASSGVRALLQLLSRALDRAAEKLLQTKEQGVFCTVNRDYVRRHFSFVHEWRRLRSWRRRAYAANKFMSGWMLGSLTLCATSLWTPSALVSAAFWWIIGSEARAQWLSEDLADSLSKSRPARRQRRSRPANLRHSVENGPIMDSSMSCLECDE